MRRKRKRVRAEIVNKKIEIQTIKFQEVLPLEASDYHAFLQLHGAPSRSPICTKIKAIKCEAMSRK